MRRGQIYKHASCNDAAIEVIRIVHIPEKRGYKVKVSWVNVVNPKNIYSCGLTEEIFIPSSKIKEWEVIP